MNNRTAPSLDVRVPTCPEWTLFDLVRHLGEGRRRWAAVVAAGPASAPPAKSAWEGAPAAPRGRHQLQEIALHTYDAQITVGAPRPLPDEVALDGVDEFLSTCCATTPAPWARPVSWSWSCTTVLRWTP
jgi:hypothetical protein